MQLTKKQGIFFGIVMSYAMAIGMEIYNVAIKMGFNLHNGGFSNMTYQVFPAALLEATYMGAIVFVVSSLYGNRVGAAFAKKHTNPEKDNPYFCRLMRQAGTVAIMCPSMSLVATFLFNIIMGGQPVSQFFVIWVGTVLKNFPMAFFWNMFAAAPFTHWFCGKCFKAFSRKKTSVKTSPAEVKD